ncbi:Bypass of stop codon protein 6 [Colletotrichum spinosum]|uniref:Bypass of stop codon protein 6 n=1 Tax=Colletotrichum spinosum TaxID=1347390 RepID=A0A4R8Q866_9PEZI|nr:Bypass of stop codon protein 6 [Colletotrichum spinosum]
MASFRPSLEVPEGEPLLNNAADAETGLLDGNEPLGDDESNMTWRIIASAFSFVVAGLFTSTTGVVIPHLQEYYHLSDIHVSAIFLVTPIGYVLASRLNDRVHNKFGQRGIAIASPLCQLIYAAVACFRPPFPLFLVGVAIGSFGIGLIDGSWCAWVAGLPKANTLSGLLHGSFSTGAAICPYLAGIMLSESGSLWYRWYFVLAASSVADIIVLAWAFRREDSERYHQSKLRREIAGDSQKNGAIFQYSATWVYAVYLLAYVGTECTISGWVVSFMLRVRKTTTYASSICSSGFWAGMAVGRLLLGAVTDKLGPKRAVVVYLLFAPVLTILFIFIRVLWFSVFAMAAIGFVMGPLFPSAVVVLVNLLPKDLHVAAVSFVASLGQVGGALLPYMLGAITQVAGLEAFQYMLLVQFVVLLGIWMLSFRLSVPKELEDEQDNHLRQD